MIHRWNSYPSTEGILDALGADIICFQEMKSSRATLPRDVALPGPYHSFFSFPVNKGGYSGVAVYANSRKATPLRAEEGLTGMLQPKPPMSPEERVSMSYPLAHDFDPFPDDNGEIDSGFDALDSEGRTLVVDFGLFVLINVYCPAETSDARLPFKMNFHLLLQERIRKLIEKEHRDVIVVGDINIAATPLDHAEGNLPSSVATFWDHPAREWFRNWLDPNGPMVDMIRIFWPERRGLYTCWNTKLQARETNYGARIDYVLATKGLLPWIKHGDIQASLKGSDHCPIYIDLHDELLLENGETIKLRDAMKQNEVTQPPRLCAKFWDEFSGKQTVLSTFFGKREEMPSQTPSASPVLVTTIPSSKSITRSISSSKINDQRTSGQSAKRKPSDKGLSSGPNKKNKVDPGQAKLASFFSKPSRNKSTSRDSSSKNESKNAWSNLFTPLRPPKCTVHGEPAKLYTVNKQGPNKGKKFYICSRPVGPGYDKGKGERLREEVNYEYRCNFFKWASEVRREALQQSGASRD
ncbi:hypothetical protein IEO21_07948 [Rhodonia placenta]|uniref:DNA-(apurinic or apyrimidinic site) endonuclease n=1 Tax=Rhodonia placenta TaxID=104341 RepID=A0A8H7NXJ6_9APHY|nr:hypothetical protein IEO21_07948 [Postia placenta]